jgi:isopenicillin-N epimerase
MYRTIGLRQLRTRFTLNRILLHQPAVPFATQDIVDAVQRSLTARTRILALTWVHSSTGVRLPIAEISAVVRQHNAGRSEEDKTLFFLDGVHGLAVIKDTFENLGCDFFVAGTHKWYSGPRGTGIAVGTSSAWAQIDPTFDTFSGRSAPGPLNTPGGFADYEHRSALAEATEFLECVGLERIQNRIADLCTRFKVGVQSHPRIRMYTPLSADQSAGIVCFDILGFTPQVVVEQLRLARILATTTPYAVTYPRVSFSMFNNEADVDATIRAVLEIANRP